MIDDLRNFKALADNLNFTKTAKKICMSTSALTRSIERLEKDLGVTLVERDSRNVRLTLSGEAFYRGITDIIESYDSLVARTKSLSKQGSSVRIGGHITIPGIMAFAEMVRRRVEEQSKPYVIVYDPVHLALENRQPGHLDPVDDLPSDNDISLVFTNSKIKKDGMVVEKLYELPFLAFTSVKSGFVDEQEIELADLKNCTFVLADTFNSYWIGLLEACEESGFTPKSTTRWISSSTDYLHPKAPDEVFVFVEGASYVDQIYKQLGLVRLHFSHDPKARIAISAVYQTPVQKENVADCLDTMRNVLQGWKGACLPQTVKSTEGMPTIQM